MRQLPLVAGIPDFLIFVNSLFPYSANLRKIVSQRRLAKEKFAKMKVGTIGLSASFSRGMCQGTTLLANCGEGSVYGMCGAQGQAGRARQATREFAVQYARRARIAGTLSQGVRTTRLRRAHYRGLAKTHVQEVASATALSLLST